MEEDWFLYSITLFTFAVIFGMCYIRYKFTFFERNKMISASNPNFPFGNIYDVVFNKTPMFMQLWKFYNRFKRKKCKCGGFYVFLKPAVLIVDSVITRILWSSSNEHFQDPDDVKCSDFNKEFGDKILNYLFKKRKRNSFRKDDVLQFLLDNGCPASKVVDYIYNFIYNLHVSFNLILLSLYELSLNNEIQEDLRGEIMRFRKMKTIITVDDLNELKYLETVVCEDLLLFVSIFGIHHDAQNYVNPELFDPDRFSEENEKFINPLKYIPFGFRSKEDFDSRYVTVIMKLTLVEFISKFKILFGKKSPKSLKFDETTFELKTKDDMWLKLEKLL
ncbi:cytochrome P450-like protein [Asbolus verrucosus]|uniref:Cytochrome P450-like protein n=1 Tax=Asbolus verrucosus TaxID=1661398 RepID=A0A482VV59_ASBVE|nr:cytochrome P450-like protein [Asbolus verrucosus]